MNGRPADAAPEPSFEPAGIGIAIGLIFLLLAIGGLGLGHGLAGWTASGLLLVVLSLLLALALRAARPRPTRPFGPANQITFARAALTCLLAGALPSAEGPAWVLVGVATVAALLDAVDGWAARRFGTVSAFGARFDLETDALLILVLSLLAWRCDRSGAWVLLSGLLRYGFVLSGLAWAWIAAPLAASKRRQTICVIQVVSLIVCLAPVLPRWLAAAIAGFGLICLLASFAIDTVRLWRGRGLPAAQGR